jgi:hypothetical protein
MIAFARCIRLFATHVEDIALKCISDTMTVLHVSRDTYLDGYKSGVPFICA